MDEAGEIVAVSIPFTTGAALGTLLLPASFGRTAAMVCAPVLLAFEGYALLNGTRGRVSRAGIAIMFLGLGLFCALSHGLCYGSGAEASALASFAERCLEALKGKIRSLPFEDGRTAGLLCALLAGDKSGLGTAELQAFRASGASHILALSGLHLGVICLIVSRVLIVLGNSPGARAARGALTVAFAGFYTVMTGAGPSIVRAFLFILFSEAGRLMPERRRSPLRTLMMALTVQLALNPGVIAELGFQLSYLAMTGIFIIYPKMAEWYPRGRRFDPFGAMWRSAALSVSCQMLTAPLVWVRFHTFPKYFILTNMLALPLTTALMTCAVAALICSFLTGCPQVLAKITEQLADALVSVLEVISGL